MRDETLPVVDLIEEWIGDLIEKVWKLYHKHPRFFNDGIVELICLVIANAFVWILSYYFIGGTLVVILLLVSTPITFGLKFLLHKHWVWKQK